MATTRKAIPYYQSSPFHVLGLINNTYEEMKRRNPAVRRSDAEALVLTTLEAGTVKDFKFEGTQQEAESRVAEAVTAAYGDAPPAVEHWIDKNGKRFWANVRNIADKNGYTEKTQDLVHAALEAEHVKDFPGTEAEAYARIQQYITDLIAGDPNAAANVSTPAGESAADKSFREITGGDPEPAAEPDSAAVARFKSWRAAQVSKFAAYQMDEKEVKRVLGLERWGDLGPFDTDAQYDQYSAYITRIRIAMDYGRGYGAPPPASAPAMSTADVNAIFTEAPFSSCVKAYTESGFDVMLTVRDSTVKGGMEKVATLVDYLPKHGYTSTRLGGQPAAPSRPPKDAEPDEPPRRQQNGNATKSVGDCVLIDVGTAYSSGKSQLNFTVDGFDKPLRYTRPVADMVKLLKGCTDARGRAFTADMLEDGRKFAGAWLVEYDDSGKYINVLSVRNAD